MKSKLILRIAALLLVIHVVGHTFGHLGWDNPEDPALKQVVTEMKTHEAEFMGATRSMADYYNGYSLIIFGLFGMSIALIWVASQIIETHRTIAAQILYPIGLTFLFFGIIEYQYFFAFAAAMSFFAGVLILVGIVMAKPQTA